MSSIISARRAPFPESNVHLGHAFRTTTNVGTIRPIGFFPIVPGDDVFFAGGGLVRLLPIRLPFLSRFKVSIDMFFVPYKLYCKDLRDNNVSTFDPNNIQFPLISFAPVPNADHITYSSIDYARPAAGGSGTYISGDMIPFVWLAEYANSWNPSGYAARYSPLYQDAKDKEAVLVESGSFMNLAGLPVGFCNTKKQRSSALAGEEHFCALRPLMYVDIFRNYYANLQVDYVPLASEAVMNQPADDTQAAIEPIYELKASYGRRQVIKCSALDEFIEQGYNFKATTEDPYFITSHFENGAPANPLRSTEIWCGRDSALFCRSFKPYFEETWINKSKYDTGPGAISVQVEGDQVLLTSIRSGSKILKFSELSVAGGYRYDDFLSVQFDVRTTSDTTTPVYLGSSYGYIASDPLYQLAPGESANSGIGSGVGAIGGTASGQINLSPRRWSFHEFGEIVVLASIVPETSYFTTIDPFLEKTTLNTLYYPSLDRLGFQPLMYRHIRNFATTVAGHIPASATPSADNIYLGYETSVDDESGEPLPGSSQDFYNMAVGYQPAWSEYTRLEDRITGDLSTSLRPWVLARVPGDVQSPSEDVQPTWVPNRPIQAQLLGDLYNMAITPTPCYDISSYFSGDPFAGYLNPVYMIDTYVRPSDYNYLFEDTSAFAHNFIFEIMYQCDVRRQKSKLNMPTFGL
ncbi:MAG: major capsid protein [Microviridae sp.]|nr:MAG: major capsid protein [Microviridae sp.]